MTIPFEPIPKEAAELLRPVLPALADEIVAGIASEVPDYARAMEGPFGHAVRVGVERALGRFVDALVDPGAAAPGARDETYVQLGRGEMRVGRSLDALLAAYRVGARLAWRRFVDTGVEAGLEPQTLYRLGEAIFAYIDAISAESIAGYAEEQSARAGERERRRRDLVRAFAAFPLADEETLRTVADAAGWALPRTVAVLVLVSREEAVGRRQRETASPGDPGRRPTTAERAESEDRADQLAQRLAREIDLTAIGGAIEGATCVLIADPDAPGRRTRLTRVLADRTLRAALGPSVAWPEAGASAARARSAAQLLSAGGLDEAADEADGPLVLAQDHLALLALHADPGLAAALAQAGLAPLAELDETSRARLRETLRAWLDRPGQIQAVAAALDVHPQTIRYRMKQLREHYGDALDDPEQRLALSLAVRVHVPDPLSL